jgi:hypothetical protein
MNGMRDLIRPMPGKRGRLGMGRIAGKAAITFGCREPAHRIV